LLLDEYGLDRHPPGAAGSDEPGDRRQQMEKQDSQIAHAPHRNKPPESLEILRNLEFAMHMLEEILLLSVTDDLDELVV
jgi:hypothetical protein